MNTKAVWIIVLILLLLIVGYLAFAMGNEPARDTAESTEPSTTTEATTTPPDTDPVAISYDGESFSPADVTVPLGTTITWTNTSGERMWVASDDHPTHTRYEGSSVSEHCESGAATSPSVFDQCGAGTEYSFTFTKTGSWGYHNHANASAGGTITVE